MIYIFDDYALDPDRRELRRNASLVSVEPQVFDLLEHLIRNRERVVTRDDLIASVWGGRIVSESALSTRINGARTAIGDSGKEQRLIRTLMRKGVRFVGTVREDDPASRTATTSTEATEAREPAPAQPEVTATEAPPALITAAVAVPDPPSPAVHLGPKVSERRQLTVALCQLVGPQTATHALELEDLEDAIAAYHRCVADAMAQFNGVVAQRVGNIALVCFGYPAANEDDAEQAVRAGLKLCAAVKSNLHAEQSWQCCVGIATGMVIVNSPPADGGDAQKLELVGDPPDVGARLQALAEPDTVVIDQSTRQLIGDLFDCRDIGAADMSGTARAWEVLGPGAAESRFVALHAAALTPLVGRDEEVDLLVRRWEQATRGADERVVLIAGEPGIGKSRLVADLEARLRSQTYARLHFSCSPRHADSALHPIVAQLERSIRFEPGDTPERKFARLESHLAAAGTPADDVALLADLMSLPASNRHPPLHLSPQRKKELTSEATVRRIASLARRSPVLMIFEDMHWIDPTSLDVVSLAIERLQSLPVLVLITFRTEFQPPWLGQPNVTMMSLTRLGRRESVAMAQQVAGDTALPGGLLDEIAKRTDGVPLYIEELTKAVMEADGLPEGNAGWSLQLRASAVPPTLQTSLMARLDRIGPAKQIAQVGAAIGREFSYELLSAVVEEADDELQAALERLTETGLVFRRGSPPRSSYVFKHALIQDTAYSTLLRRRRQELHASIAAALETRFPDITALQPEILAHHLVQAGQPGNAAQYWIRAGDLASRRSIGREAAGHYRSALRDLSAEPEDAPIRQIEPEVHMKLGNVLIQSEGYGSPAAIDAYRRAQESAAALDQPENYAKAAIGLAPLLFSGCRYREVASTLEDISERLLDQLPVDTQIHLFTMLAVANYCLGDFSRAWDRLDAARALDQQSPCTQENPVGGGDPAIVIRNYMAMCGAVLGRLQEGLALTEEGLTIARTRNDAFTVAWALLGRLRALRAVDRFSEGIVLGDEAIDICERHGFRARLGSVLIARAINHLGIGDMERGLADMRRGIDLWRETSGDFHMSEWHSYLVARLLHAGRRNDAEALLTDAERIVDQTDEKSHCAEIWRLRANILRRDGAMDEATSLLAGAINWAGRRHAKVFELRASLDLARMYLDAGRSDTAAAILKHAVALFPNETVFPDLREARDLLTACG